MVNYILVVDDEEDIRDIFEMVLCRSFPLDVVMAASGNEALEIIRKRGMPEIIISDLNMPDGDGLYLYQQLKQNEWNIPFVICSTDSLVMLKKKFPGITGYVEKPKVIDTVINLVDSVVSQHKSPPTYVPLRISLLLRKGTANFDLYMKLSESKFIKVINAGEAFIPDDAERFTAKGLNHLFISSEDADQFLLRLEHNLTLINNSEATSEELTILSLESLEAVERIASSLGWSSLVIESAKRAVDLAIKTVSKEPNILNLFNQKFNDPHSKYSSHVSTLALLTCGFCYQLGWTSESTQMKLGLASLMHDLTLDDKVYDDVNLWNEAASDSKDKTAEALKYRNHPSEAANLLLSMKDIPNDVDQIILQHHEMKDGTGFPRGLISSRITPMACVFIIVEDLINFLEDSPNFDEKISLYLKRREERYSSGNFKKVFMVLKDTAEKARKKS